MKEIHIIEACTPARFHSHFVSVSEAVIHGPLLSFLGFTFLDELAIPSISSCKILDPAVGGGWGCRYYLFHFPPKRKRLQGV